MSSSAPRAGHPYHMHDAIYAQPGALRLVMRGQGDILARAAAKLAAAPHVWLTGVGTSWHAALAGELLLAQAGRLGSRVRAINTFELVSYGPAAQSSEGCVVISHRGGSPSGPAALARTQAAGGVTVAVTGKGSDGLAAAEHVLRTVDQEASGCHTVSYTTALAVLASLAAAIGRDDDLSHQLDALPDQLAFLLGQEAWESLAERFGGRRRYWFLGGGPSVATAYEAALKLSEAAWVSAIGLECEQFLHGPWAALERNDVVVVIAPPGPSHARCRDAARVAKEIGATVVALVAEGDSEIGPLAAETIALPEVSELLSPITAMVPLQLLIYHLAVRAGANPDTVREGTPHGRARASAAP